MKQQEQPWLAIPLERATPLLETTWLRGAGYNLVERFITVGSRRYAEMRMVRA